jgi:hypothetical protein
MVINIVIYFERIRWIQERPRGLRVLYHRNTFSLPNGQEIQCPADISALLPNLSLDVILHVTGKTPIQIKEELKSLNSDIWNQLTICIQSFEI